nr:SMI1/KNR4 family protein [uncultured Capnocytophaga sp.]
MQKIKKILQLIQEDSECVWSSPKGEPILPNGLSLPDDLLFFYKTMGSLVLFPREDFYLEVVSPFEFVRANPIIAGEDWSEDINYNWFIIAKADGFGGQYITIDLGNDRTGFCYDSFWDKYVNFECPIIAKSFTEFLELAYSTKGKEWYWTKNDFQDYGTSHPNLSFLN